MHSVIFSTIRELSDWVDLPGDSMLTAVFVDRAIHRTNPKDERRLVLPERKPSKKRNVGSKLNARVNRY